jgi:chemotaxis protein CheZ
MSTAMKMEDIAALMPALSAARNDKSSAIPPASSITGTPFACLRDAVAADAGPAPGPGALPAGADFAPVPGALPAVTDFAPVPGAKTSPEVFQQIGTITRLLHDTLQQLGVMPQLQLAANGLPDARSRLNYIATKTADAADKVLDSVDQAKAEHLEIAKQTRLLAAALLANPVKAVASGAVFNFVNDVDSRIALIDGHLTDIMMAQDFHDLTGQVVAKVVALANELEDSLVKLLVQVVPPEQREKVEASVLNGPVVDPGGRTDVVANQGEVDDLLASLGF